MRHRFTCQAVTSNDGIRRIHLVADDGTRRGDLFLNIPHDWFDLGEEPRENDRCVVKIEIQRGPSRAQRS